MGKKPKRKQNPSSKKTPISIEQPDSYMSKKPSWAFSKAQKTDKWSCLKDDVICKTINVLRKYEHMTWQQIRFQTHDSSGSNHYITNMNDLHKDAKVILEERNLDSDCLFSLRDGNTTRIYGILEEGVLYVLWYDNNHGDNDDCVVRAKKKHT